MSRAAPQFCSLSAINLQQIRIQCAARLPSAQPAPVPTLHFHNRSAYNTHAPIASNKRGHAVAGARLAKAHDRRRERQRWRVGRCAKA